MKALSIRQPWAGLIVDGSKRIENRTWNTHRRGWVLVHVSLTWNPTELEAFQFCRDRGLLEDAATAKVMRTVNRPCGGIIGAMRIDDCVKASDSPWFTGPFGFVIGAVVKLPFLPVRGKQGFFNVDLPTGGHGQANYYLQTLAAIRTIDAAAGLPDLS